MPYYRKFVYTTLPDSLFLFLNFFSLNFVRKYFNCGSSLEKEDIFRGFSGYDSVYIILSTVLNVKTV